MDLYMLAMSAAVLVLLVWAFTVAFLLASARQRSFEVKVNLLCATGVVLAVVALLTTDGWTLTHGDVGMSRGMELFFAFASLLALVSPLAGWVQLSLLISELSWAASTESAIVGVAFPIALLSTAVVIMSMAAPFGPGIRPVKASLKERLLTVAVKRAS
ncbi:MAG: hypothetical protein A3K67_05615 [Euryarchaeota archaeon RBG_16_62_10]|nr:MAG: hypothetical protein A3K67_05615 [Euryarchaeota archaeon RBG_16_62_10]